MRPAFGVGSMVLLARSVVASSDGVGMVTRNATSGCPCTSSSAYGRASIFTSSSTRCLSRSCAQQIPIQPGRRHTQAVEVSLLRPFEQANDD